MNTKDKSSYSSVKVGEIYFREQGERSKGNVWQPENYVIIVITITKPDEAATDKRVHINS